MEKIKLDIGCGTSKKTGYLGMDILPLEGVDFVTDLNEFPYPVESNSVDEIWMDNVLEHLKEPLLVIEELHRVSKNKSKITISVPYFRSFYAYIDPTHRNFISSQYFNYFDPNHDFCKKYQYSKARFNIEKIEFDREWKGNMRFFHKRLVRFAEKYPTKYESKLAHLLPLSSLTFYLEVVK